MSDLDWSAPPTDLERLTLVRVRLPLRSAHVAAHGTEAVRDVILVAWRRPDGYEGWGECPTLSTFGYADEVTDTAWSFLTGDLARSLTAGVLPDLPSGLRRRTTMARSAVADARLDAALRAAGTPLWRHLGASAAPRPTMVVVGLDAGVPAGDDPVKLKVTPVTLERARAVRRASPQRVLALDANGSFASPADLPTWIDELDLEYLEQPLPPADLAGHAALRRRLRTPVALDESVAGDDDLERAVAAGALDLLNVKPARLGGVAAAAAVVRRCRERGVGCFVGGMLETGIGRAGALAVAGLEGVGLRTDLGPSSRYFERDVCDPIEADADGCLAVPDGPGIGRTPSPERLAEVGVARVEILRG